MKKSLALLLAGVFALAARARDWPTQPVRLVVPGPAGSSLDFIARTLGERLRECWTQPVLVESKAGAGGMPGMTAVAQAPADGHTLGIGFNGPARSPSVRTRTSRWPTTPPRTCCRS